ncbi:hypothetical protein BWQ96_02838 [Gracilariopsis chorda]|uniref:Uncharacterized protein n=1 Tax=Gracilariopsis chorda TaxID=448386 RepID=A0A2V3IYY3_9FLOR|nr:hypothetical protein BWQ96_02838 [Gracilariopsis chorda]|eukprot:PXF47358.1 hypothetical protein BWQ96_02838 [Gracilariopsis chorda]
MSAEPMGSQEAGAPASSSGTLLETAQGMLVINGREYSVAYIKSILGKVEASLGKLTLQFSKMYEQMMLSDEPNEEADGVRLKHFATNAFVNGVLVERPVDKEFLDLIGGLIARVQLETLMYRFKYGHDYERIEDIRIMMSAILYFKRLETIYATIPHNESRIWPQVPQDLYEEVCRIAANRYRDHSDRRASALLFSQLLDHRTITMNNPVVGNIDLYAYVTNGNTAKMIWECLSGIRIEHMKAKEGETYHLSSEELTVPDALDILTEDTVRAIRTKEGLTYHNAKFANIEEWKFSDPNSRYIEVRTKSLYVFLSYLYLATAASISVIAAVLNWGRRNSKLHRMFDTVALLLIFTVAAWIPLKLLGGMSNIYRTLLCGRTRLQGLETLAGRHATSVKDLLLALARSKSVRFLKHTNSCFVAGPKTGTVDLPLLVRECDLEDVVIIGEDFAYDVRGTWRYVDGKKGVVHFGDEIPKDTPAVASRIPGRRLVGGRENP